MTKRFILWFSGIIFSFSIGLYLDKRFPIFHLPLTIKALAVVPMGLSFILLVRSGRLLRKLGQPKEQWGWTTKLVTSDLYSCLRHPHHLGIGLFVFSLSLLIGELFTITLANLFIWPAIVRFILKIEEKELLEKFGEEYVNYKKNTPMLFPSPGCLFSKLFLSRK